MPVSITLPRESAVFCAHQVVEINVVFSRAEFILGKDIIHVHFLLLITGHHIILGLDLKEAVALRVERLQPVEAVLCSTFSRKWTVVSWRCVGTLQAHKHKVAIQLVSSDARELVHLLKPCYHLS